MEELFHFFLLQKTPNKVFGKKAPSAIKGHQTVIDILGADLLFGIHKAYGTSNGVVYWLHSTMQCSHMGIYLYFQNGWSNDVENWNFSFPDYF